MITKVNLLMFSQDASKYDAFPKTIAMEDKINKNNDKISFYYSSFYHINGLGFAYDTFTETFRI